MQLSKKWEIIFKNRIVYIIILLISLYLLCIYYSENYEKHREYPSTGDILNNYPEGKEVFVSGTVIKINNGSFIIANYYKEKNINFTIESQSPVLLKDDAFVYGILKPSYTITSLKTTIIPTWEYTAVIIRSLIGLMILLFIFNKYWKIDLNKLLFIRRK